MPPPNHEVIEEFTDRFALKTNDAPRKCETTIRIQLISHTDVSIYSSFKSDFFDFVVTVRFKTSVFPKKKSHHNV